MLEEYAEFCYDQIGSYVLNYIDYFEDLRPQLSKANIDVSLPEYTAMLVFSTAISTLFSLLVLGSIFVLGSGITGAILGLASSLVIGTATMLMFYLYPSILIRNRASKIRDTLPFATMYMSTLAGTGTSIQDIFTVLAEQEEYGEVSQEAERISRDIETFGMDLSEALKKAADRTPSNDFKELMWGMNHVITSGGSLRDFLQERSRTLMNQYQRRVEEFADQLSLLVEMYITIVIVGSIIFTSMSAVMSSFTSMSGNFIVTIQMLAIFIVLPLISGMFIILVRGMAPGGVR
jgi:flagellar protein FlaJ